MPPTLHPHLKRRLDFDDVQVGSEDAIEKIPAGYQGSQEWAAKRRRVEAIASRYLQGKPPVILSAALRGPFNNGWKNPWADRSRITAKEPAKDSAAMDHRSRPSRRTTTEATGTTRARNRRSKEADVIDLTTHIASPEASRAAQYEPDLQAYQPDDSLDEVEVPPATAPLPEEDVSDTTEFFSANTEKCIQNRSPLTNPFWLRRPESEATLNMKHNTEVSPTRSRSRDGHSQPGVGGRLHLALPKAPLCGQGFSTREDVLEECRSSASASMILSSPAKGNTMTSNERDSLQKGVADQEGSLQPASTPIGTPVGDAAHDSGRGLQNTGGGHCGQRNLSAASRRGDYSESNAESIGAEIPHSTLYQNASSGRSHDRPSREDIQRSAQRLVDLIPPSSASNRQLQQSSRKDMRDKSMRRAPQHDLVASPAPASSTGFVYRKVGNSKRKGSNAETSKVRVINFNSSPAIQTDTTISNEQSLERASATSKSEPCTKDAHQTDVANANEEPILQFGEEEDGADGSDIQEERKDLRSSHSSRNSAFSTQAAMLLARIEFQESAFAAMASGSPRLWSQPQNDTPRPEVPKPSAAITPLSASSAQLDKSLLNKSVLHRQPMSTQELFAAISPFAFSTVKKNSELPQRSSLRFSLLQNDGEQSRTNDTFAKSPTPSADRIPLKAKNTTTPLWSFATEKASQASQASQGSLVDRSRRSISDVELPQLDFHTSLDDYGLNGGLHFTDRFLRNLDDS